MSPRASLGLGHVEDPGVLSKPPCEMALSLEAALYPSQVVESGAAIEYMSRLLTEEGACGLSLDLHSPARFQASEGSRGINSGGGGQI